MPIKYTGPIQIAILKLLAEQGTLSDYGIANELMGIGVGQVVSRLHDFQDAGLVTIRDTGDRDSYDRYQATLTDLGRDFLSNMPDKDTGLRVAILQRLAERPMSIYQLYSEFADATVNQIQRIVLDDPLFHHLAKVRQVSQDRDDMEGYKYFITDEGREYITKAQQESSYANSAEAGP